MRGTLFRGKRVDNDEWTYGFYFERLINGDKHSYIKYETFDEGFVVDEVDANTIGQYTGIKDEQCVRIFEGDILEVSYDDGTAYTTEVYAYGSTLCVDIEGEDYDVTAIDFAVDIWKDNWCKFEVIGNIYDNKELSEDKNNG